MSFNLATDYPMHSAGGACYLCGQAKRKDEIVIDCNKNIDREGNLFICETCVIELTGLVGGLPKKKAAKLAEENKILQEKVNDQQARINLLDEALRAVRAVDAEFKASV